MAAIVEDLFALFEAGRRGATAMLLTYRRFAELVPPGSSGDARVVSLASALDRLGLDQAASEVLRGRLQQGDARDEGRARLGLALAELLARRGDPRGAIAALLDTTPLDVIDPLVAAARRELMAGLGQAGDRQAGGEDLPVDQQLTLLRERARAAFAREAWHEVVAAGPPFEALLPATGPLDRASAELLLMVATAARRLADDALLERLAGAMPTAWQWRMIGPFCSCWRPQVVSAERRRRSSPTPRATPSACARPSARNPGRDGSERQPAGRWRAAA
jgi:hypothetical protein